MLYAYAVYSKKHNALHFMILFSLLIICFIHLALMLETEKLWLVAMMFIYVPIYLIWCRVSTYRDKINE